jgi:flagellar biosynthesis protein FliQ
LADETQSETTAEDTMTPEFAVELVKMLMVQAVMLALPILVTAMAVGLSISLFQAVTSIQEQTLAFVPKALGVTAIVVLLLPWLLRSSIEFASAVISKMPEMVR